MENQDIRPVIGKKIARAWRGYGFFTSFDFADSISINIEGPWGFVRDGKDLVNTESTFEEIDNFLNKTFEPNKVSISDFEIQDDVTVITFSNGVELEMNNKFNEEDGWYLLNE